MGTWEHAENAKIHRTQLVCFSGSPGIRSQAWGYDLSLLHMSLPPYSAQWLWPIGFPGQLEETVDLHSLRPRVFKSPHFLPSCSSRPTLSHPRGSR